MLPLLAVAATVAVFARFAGACADTFRFLAELAPAQVSENQGFYAFKQSHLCEQQFLILFQKQHGDRASIRLYSCS